MARVKFPITLTDSREIAPDVRHLTFERADGQPFDFIPGQFINLFFPIEDTVIQRSYSLANSPEGKATIELALSHVSDGKASGYLFAMQPGDEIEASGPFGRLVLRDEDPKRYVLIATGTGVTPYRSMLPELAKRIGADTCEVALLLGARNPEDLLYKQEFIDFAAQHTHFNFYACCSRSQSEPAIACERKGYVQETFAELALNPESDIVYLCGNPNMVDDAYQLLLDIGFDKQNVRREKYVFSH